MKTNPISSYGQEQLAHRVAIEELNACFTHCLDHGDHEGLVDVFTADARYVSGASELLGCAAIVSYFQSRSIRGARTTRHMGCGLRLRFETVDRAKGQSVWLSFACNAVAPIARVTPFMVADFEDLYVRDETGLWRVHERIITPVFRDPEWAALS